MRSINRLVINGQVLEDVYIGKEYTYKTADVARVASDIVGRDSVIPKRTERKGVEETIPVVVMNQEGKSYEEVIDYLVEVLHYGNNEVLEIGFTDTEYHQKGYFQGSLEISAYKYSEKVYELDLSVKYIDPNKYSNREILREFSGSSLILDNSGGVVRPTIKLTATGKSRYVSIVNKTGGEIFTLGESGFTELGNANNKEDLSIGNFLEEGATVPGNYDGKNSVKARELYSNSGFNKTDGRLTPHRLYRGYTFIQQGVPLRPYEDGYEVTYKIRVKGINPGGYGEAFLLLLDEEGNEVVEFGVKVDNNPSNIYQKGKAVPYLHMTSSEFNGYREMGGITSKEFGNPYEEYDIYMKLERRGNTTKLKTWRYGMHDGKLKHNDSAEFTDKSGSVLNGTISSVVLGFGSKNNTEMVGLEIEDSVKMYSLSGTNERHSFIIQPNDIIEIDSEIYLVTINGEPVTHLKDGGTDYLSVERGLNNYEIYPRRTFGAEMRYKNTKL